MEENNAVCAICMELLPGDGDYVKCHGFCKSNFHYACTTIKKTTYKQMSIEKKMTWRCVNCRRDKILEEKLNVVDLLRQEIVDLKQTVKESLSKQEELLEKYSLLLKRVEKNESIILSLNGEIDAVKSESLKRDEEIRKLTNQIDYREQKEFESTVEICGVERVNGENLKNIFTTIISKLDLKEIEENVLSINRVVGRDDKKTLPIIVKFKNSKTKELIIEKKRKVEIKNLEIIENGKQPDCRIFINEHLTSFKRGLFWQTRNKARENKYRYVWTKNGNIYVKKTENDKVLKIFNTVDLNDIF